MTVCCEAARSAILATAWLLLIIITALYGVVFQQAFLVP